MKVTIILEHELHKDLIKLQGREIIKSGKGISFSKVCNDVLKKGLKK